MGLIWWVLPALAGLVGLMLVFAGLGRLLKMKPMSGLGRMVFGVGFLGLAGVVTFAGLNLQTYKRLTFERPVATISFAAVEERDDAYEATLLLPEGESRRYVVTGDEFVLGARVITFKPFANMIGYDSVYRLDYFEGRPALRYNSRSVSESRSEGVRLTENPGLDVAELAKRHGARMGLRDANFGSAVYNPMSDGLKYEVSITRTGLIARAANEATRRAIGQAPQVDPAALNTGE